MKILLFILITILSSIAKASGDDKILFTQKMLDQPASYLNEFNSIFSYNEISRFQNKTKKGFLVLENGYAKSEIKNANEWTAIKKGKKVTEITIIFTKYPRKKRDWITDYDRLLADRLIELFKIDPELNNKNIHFSLLLQTDCRSDKETRNFFHGISIKYEKVEIKEKSFVSDKNEIVKPENISSEKNIPKKNNNWSIDDQKYFEDNSFLNRDKIPYENKPKKKRKEPACPDFKSKRKSFIK